MVYENVGQLIEGRQLRSISDNSNIYDACAVLDRCNVGALAVVRQGNLVGIFSERDVVRRVVMQGRDFIATRVADVMTPNPQVIDASGGLIDALKTMREGHFRHLPVLRQGALIGMVSIRDIPVEYSYMQKRYEEILSTPVVEAEAATNQHLQSSAGSPGPHASGALFAD